MKKLKILYITEFLCLPSPEQTVKQKLQVWKITESKLNACYNKKENEPINMYTHILTKNDLALIKNTFPSWNIFSCSEQQQASESKTSVDDKKNKYKRPHQQKLGQTPNFLPKLYT